MALRVHGLTHLALTVRDPERSLAFYRAVFGCKEYWRDAGSIEVLGPGPWDVLAFQRGARKGKDKGVQHFGFRLTEAKAIRGALKAIRAAGGKVVDQGEFVPGSPYVFFEDPDGYVIEVWYEPAPPHRAGQGATAK